MTNFEDSLKDFAPKVQGACRSGDAKELSRLVMALSKGVAEVNLRLAEVTEMITEMQKRAYQELLQTLQAT